jgi:hypothetical protein
MCRAYNRRILQLLWWIELDILETSMYPWLVWETFITHIKHSVPLKPPIILMSVDSIRSGLVNATSAPPPIFRPHARRQPTGAPAAATPSLRSKPCYRLIILCHPFTPCTFQCPIAFSTPLHTDFWKLAPLSITTHHGSTPSTSASMGEFQEGHRCVRQDRAAGQVGDSTWRTLSLCRYLCSQRNKMQ